MYRLSPKNVTHIVNTLKMAKEDMKHAENPHLLDDEIETFSSILAVMEASDQKFVYIVGRDPEKI